MIRGSSSYAALTVLALAACPAPGIPGMPGMGDTGTDADETETETGQMCTGEVCNSTLTLSFTHALPLLEGPHRFRIQTPDFELVCSVEASLEGDKSCFGFAFSDLSWTAELVTVLLTNPFYETADNPEALPFASVMLSVERGDALIHATEVSIEGGDVMTPDPCGPACWDAVGVATIP